MAWLPGAALPLSRAVTRASRLPTPPSCHSGSSHCCCLHVPCLLPGAGARSGVLTEALALCTPERSARSPQPAPPAGSPAGPLQPPVLPGRPRWAAPAERVCLRCLAPVPEHGSCLLRTVGTHRVDTMGIQAKRFASLSRAQPRARTIPVVSQHLPCVHVLTHPELLRRLTPGRRTACGTAVRGGPLRFVSALGTGGRARSLAQVLLLHGSGGTFALSRCVGSKGRTRAPAALRKQACPMPTAPRAWAVPTESCGSS